MRCPFLREEQVKSCQAAPFRKSVARSAAHAEMERCSSSAHVECPVARQSHEAHPHPGRCPFLQESLVQFCAATPVPAYVPWSSSPELRCAHGGHRFCDLFLATSGARSPLPPEQDGADTRIYEVAGVPLPGWLDYAANHLWLDTENDGVCHLGIDAFVVQLVGKVERLAFLTLKGSVRPAVVLTVRGVDLTLVFPAALTIVNVNTRLRANLERLTADPYGRGWLFEARWPQLLRASAPAPVTAHGLLAGAAAREWMQREVRRVSELAHDRLASTRGERFVADGGRFSSDLLAQLDREEVLRLFAELFPIADFRRTP
jgi:glycine cleavage system H lipoate-binding protein